MWLVCTPRGRRMQFHDGWCSVSCVIAVPSVVRVVVVGVLVRGSVVLYKCGELWLLCVGRIWQAACVVMVFRASCGLFVSVFA